MPEAPQGVPRHDVLGQVAGAAMVLQVRASIANPPVELVGFGVPHTVTQPETGRVHHIGGDVAEVLGVTPAGRLLWRDRAGRVCSPDHEVSVALPRPARVLLAGALVVAWEGHRLTAYHPESGRKVAERELAESAPDDLVRVTGDGRVALLGSHGDSARLTLVDFARPTHEVYDIPFRGSPSFFEVSPFHDRVALANRSGLLIHRLRGSVADFTTSEQVADLAWEPDGTCRWVTRAWPHSRLHTWRPGQAVPDVAVCDWSIAGLVPSSVGIRAVVNAPGLPRRSLAAQDSTRPAEGRREYAVRRIVTRRGPLRGIVYPPPSEVKGVVVFLRGGPYSEWLPAWDAFVELAVSHGFLACHLESPYTAAVQKRLPPFTRGDFGVADAEMVADAMAELSADCSLSLEHTVLVGHSYGAFLAAQAARLAKRVGGLATLNGPWCLADMLRLGGSAQGGKGSLAEFVRRGFDQEPAGPAPAPAEKWLVVLGADDPVFPPDIARSAIERDRPPTVLILEGGGHVARSRGDVVRVLTALDALFTRAGSDRS